MVHEVGARRLDEQDQIKYAGYHSLTLQLGDVE